jgi:hypothetical protein
MMSGKVMIAGGSARPGPASSPAERRLGWLGRFGPPDGDLEMTLAKRQFVTWRHSRVLRRVYIGAVLLELSHGCAAAFPLIDPTNADSVPPGTELAAPDAQDLKHQMQLANGLLPPAGGGWTIVPRINFQEMLTDNALQANSPRQWDLISYFSPGIHIAGDMPRLQLNFDYAPALSMYARTSSLNTLTQQMTGIGLVTAVPDLAFVDVRAVAGVQNIYGGIGGLGTIGGAGINAGSIPADVPGLEAASTGLNRNDEVQTNSFGISPYLLRQFGDWGTGKLGYSFNVTESDRLTSFAASPFFSRSRPDAEPDHLRRRLRGWHDRRARNERFLHVGAGFHLRQSHLAVQPRHRGVRVGRP